MRELSGILVAVSVLVLAANTAVPATPAPSIVSTMPAQNELNVSAGSDISATFDSDMDETTINSSTFAVFARSTGWSAGTISYDPQTRTATLDPATDFDVGDVVTVVATTGIQSASGTPLGSSYLWSFTVRAGGFGNFGPQTVYPIGFHPAGITAADLNNDGHVDLATANLDGDCISALMNFGDGSYGPRTDYEVGQAPRSLVAADFNGDGNMDLATVNQESENVSILLNNGDGSFGSAADYQVGSNPQSLAAVDLNGDGNIDLAIANTGTYFVPESGVSVLLNAGAGSFMPQVTYALDDMPTSVYGADLDGDGDIDLATVSAESHNLSVLFNDGLGSVSLNSIYPTDYSPNAVYAADLDGDGDLDLAVANGNFADKVSIFLNLGDGDFEPYCSYPVGDGGYGAQPFCIFAADLDGDEDLDLVTGNVTSLDVSLLPNNGLGKFPSFLNFPTGYGAYSVFASDLDSDGDLDLATANYGSGDVSVLLNRFVCGDADSNGLVNVSDAVHLIGYIFGGGPPPDPLAAGDVNCDDIINVSDAVYLITYIFGGGPEPCNGCR